MSRQSLAEAIRKMEASLTTKVIDFTSKKVRETSVEIKEELTTEYDYFFQMILDDVIGAIAAPGLLSQYTAWKPLTEKWAFQKQKYGGYSSGKEHYQGLSTSSSAGRALGRRTTGRSIGMSRLRANGRKPQGLIRTGPFENYIRTLTARGTTERFFGPVVASYDFISNDPNISVTVKQSGDVAVRTQVRSAERGTFIAFPKTLKMVSTISAFGNLKGLTFNEYNIVDYIIKRIDPTNEKQWVKINSQIGIGRSRRPIRAVITPILRYYMDRRFPEIVRSAIKSRS